MYVNFETGPSPVYTILHTDGSGDTDPPPTTFPALLDELAVADREHGDVSVVHDGTGWCLSAHRDGRLVFENLHDGGERHMIPVGRAKVLELWGLLINGQIEDILVEPWKPGYM